MLCLVVEVAMLGISDAGQEFVFCGTAALALIGHHDRGMYGHPLTTLRKKLFADFWSHRRWTKNIADIPRVTDGSPASRTLIF